MYSNRISEGGAPFVARITNRNRDFSVESSDLVMVDCSSGVCGDSSLRSGSYEAAYFITFAAQYAIHVEHLGLTVDQSPYRLSVLPASFMAGPSSMEGPGSWGAVANTESTFTIVARDEFGNALSEGGNGFTVHLTGPDTDKYLLPSDNGDGTYLVTYRVEVAGDFVLDVISRNQHISRSPVSPLTVFDSFGFSVPSQSVVIGDAVYGLQAGLTGLLSLQVIPAVDCL
jgi:hypothetical protein